MEIPEVSQTVLMGFKTIKESKAVDDMYDRKQVQRVAYQMGFYETANWIHLHADEYFFVLMNTNWDRVMSLHKEEADLK